MGRHVAGDAPEMDRLVEDSIRAIGAEIDAVRVPKLLGVVLGGGYGRGEGGVATMPGGSQRLSNDLDFYLVVEDGSSAAEMESASRALEPIARRWSERLGIDVDFCPPKTPWRIRHDQERLMIQELLHGYFDVAGEKGEVLFSGVERRQPSEFPWTEAVRLLVNRGAGLILARTSDDPQFVVRNVNKCVLGAGDALLIARGGYRWRAEERAKALGLPLYADAVAWKFRPRAEGVCGLEEAREIWLSATREVMEIGRRAGSAGRSLYQAARWIVRRRTLGELSTLGQGPVVRILQRMIGVIEARKPFPPSLEIDWKIFN
jgi:hypothetical protein